MAQTPTAFDTTVLVDLDSDNGMKYKMPRLGPHTPWSPIRNRRNGDHARRPSPPSDLEDSDDALAGNVQSGATATELPASVAFMVLNPFSDLALREDVGDGPNKFRVLHR